MAAILAGMLPMGSSKRRSPTAAETKGDAGDDADPNVPVRVHRARSSASPRRRSCRATLAPDMLDLMRDQRRAGDAEVHGHDLAPGIRLVFVVLDRGARRRTHQPRRAPVDLGFSRTSAAEMARAAMLSASATRQLRIRNNGTPARSPMPATVEVGRGADQGAVAAEAGAQRQGPPERHDRLIAAQGRRHRFDQRDHRWRRRGCCR